MEQVAQAERPAALILTRGFWWVGWMISVACAHFGYEIARVVGELVPRGGGGIADLSRLASLTGIFYALAMPWALIAGWRVAMWRKRLHKEVRTSGLGLSARIVSLSIVVLTFAFATWQLALARAASIRLVY